MQPRKPRWLNSFGGYYVRIQLVSIISSRITRFWTLCDQVADFNVDESVETSCIFIWSKLPFNDFVECRSFRNNLPQFCHSATFHSAKWYSATRPYGKNIPQKMFGNQLFGKKAFGNIYSENIHSEKNIKKFDNRQLFIPQNEIWKNRLSETSYSEK